jgi:hypothetical protein
MTQGLINNGASSQCCCNANHTLANAGAQPSTSSTYNRQPSNNAFQGNLPSNPESDIFAAIGVIINALSKHFAAKNVENNDPLPPPENATQNTDVDAASSNSTDQANNDNEGLDDFIISLIEQLLETLEGLMGGNESNNDNNTPTSENNSSTSTTPTTPTDPLTILDDTVDNNSADGIINLNGMTLAQQKLAAQLYELIEFMTGVGDNLEETGNDRISNLIGYLDQQLEEQWYRTRRDEMVLSLIQFLERYRDN